MPGVKKKCTCSFAQRLQGDGCEVCNPEKAIEILREQLSSSEQRVKALESENETLREIVSESCAALGATCRCSTRASLDFMAGVPGEIRMTVNALQARVKAMEGALRPIAKMWIDTKSAFENEDVALPPGILIEPSLTATFADISAAQLDAMVEALEATCQK